MRVLITGSEGFVAGHFIDALVRDHDGSLEIDSIDIAHPIADWRRDCRDFFATDDRHYDLVLHCAATVGGREGIEGHAAFLGADNLSIDGEMWKWALRTKPGRIVYFSSSAAYGSCYHTDRFPPSDESLIDFDRQTVAVPDASYGWVKLTGEFMAELVRSEGIPVSVVRPFSGYGEDQDPSYPFRAMVDRARRREHPFTVWGDGSQVRDWTHIDDIVQAVLTMFHDGIDGPVNIGTGLGTSMDELARLCMKTVGYDVPIFHDLSKPVGVHTRVADTTRLAEFYEPKITIEEGVERALRS